MYYTSHHPDPSCVLMLVAGREDQPLRIATSKWVNQENADEVDNKRALAQRGRHVILSPDSEETNATKSVFVSDDLVCAFDAVEGSRCRAVDCRSSDRSDSTSPSGHDGHEADESEDYQRTTDALRVESSQLSTDDWPRSFPVDLAARDSRYIRPQTKTTSNIEQQTTSISIESVLFLDDSLVRRIRF